MSDDWRSLFEYAPCGLVATTVEGVVTAANRVYLEWSGRDAVGEYFVSHLTRAARIYFESRLIPELRHGEIREAALLLSRPDGTELPVLVTARAMDNGEARLAIFDATGREDWERSLLVARRSAEDALQHLGVLHAASADFLAGSSRADLSAAAVKAAVTATDATAASVLVVRDDRDGGRLLERWSGEVPVDLGAMTEPGSPLLEAVDTVEPVVCRTPDEIAARFPTFAGEFRAAGVEAFCAIPGLYQGHTGGVLLCCFSRPRTIDAQMIATLSAVVAQALVVLEGVLLREELAHQARHDSLTGLPNRTHALYRLDRIMELAARKRRPVAVLFLDLDGFKAINDTLGHGAGDAVLREVATRLSDVVRSEDVVARLGGDEFLVLCDGMDEGAARGLAERILSRIREPFDGVSSTLAVSASIGIAMRPAVRQVIPAVQVLDAADAAMYEAKRGGKDAVRLVTVGGD